MFFIRRLPISNKYGTALKQLPNQTLSPRKQGIIGQNQVQRIIGQNFFLETEFTPTSKRQVDTSEARRNLNIRYLISK
jgi:hypothetical protein